MGGREYECTLAKSLFVGMEPGSACLCRLCCQQPWRQPITSHSHRMLLSAVAHLLAPSQRSLAADSPCWPGIPYSSACNRLFFYQSLTSAPGLLQNRLPLLQSAGAAWCSLASPTSTVLTQALPFLQIVPSIPGDAVPPAACLAKHAFLQVRPAAWRPPRSTMTQLLCPADHASATAKDPRPPAGRLAAHTFLQ